MSITRKTTIERPEDYERDRVGKYAPYFKDNIILPLQGISDLLEPWILSFMVVDLKTRGLTGLTKGISEELLWTAGIPVQYFCRRSFATWDVLQKNKQHNNKVLPAAAWIYGHTLNPGDSMQCPGQPHRRCSGIFPEQLRKVGEVTQQQNQQKKQQQKKQEFKLTKLRRIKTQLKLHQPKSPQKKQWKQQST